MAIRVEVEHNLADAKEKLALYPARLTTGMYEGTRRATNIVAQQLEETTTARTSMDRSMVHSMIDIEVTPLPGGIAQGKVGFKPPPKYFYPKKSKVLVFRIEGRTIFARRVRGSRPYKLVPRAVGFTSLVLPDAYGEEVRKAVGE